MTPPLEAFNVMIATPAYGGMVHTSYVAALLDYQRIGLRFTLATLDNESLITRGRNTLISTFHHRPDFTHLLFLDADVHLPADGLAALLGHGKDVIGAPVALKGRRSDGSRIFNVGATVGEAGPLLKVERVGTAAFLLSRRAVDALVAEARENGWVYERMSTLRGAGAPPIHYDVFRVGVVDSEYLSEDYWACRTLRRLGFDIHVDPEIETHHFGTLAS